MPRSLASFQRGLITAHARKQVGYGCGLIGTEFVAVSLLLEKDAGVAVFSIEQIDQRSLRLGYVHEGRRSREQDKTDGRLCDVTGSRNGVRVT